MNAFEKKISSIDAYPLKAQNITTLQVNLGYKCNLRCAHCHVEASPDRREEMSSATGTLSRLHFVLCVLQEQAQAAAGH